MIVIAAIETTEIEMAEIEIVSVIVIVIAIEVIETEMAEIIVLIIEKMTKIKRKSSQLLKKDIWEL